MGKCRNYFVKVPWEICIIGKCSKFFPGQYQWILFIRVTNKNDKVDLMELKAYFNIILKRLWILIVIPLISGGVSAFVSFFILDKVYESNTTLYVINKKADPTQFMAYNDLYAGQMLVKDYRELIKSRSVTTEVIDKLDLKDLTPKELAEQISVNSKNETRIIEINVQDTDAARARDIADEVGEVFIAKAVELMKVENVSIVDKGQVPADPVKPKPLINTAIALFAGILAALGIIFLIR